MLISQISCWSVGVEWHLNTHRICFYPIITQSLSLFNNCKYSHNNLLCTHWISVWRMFTATNLNNLTANIRRYMQLLFFRSECSIAVSIPATLVQITKIVLFKIRPHSMCPHSSNKASTFAANSGCVYRSWKSLQVSAPLLIPLYFWWSNSSARTITV